MRPLIALCLLAACSSKPAAPVSTAVPLSLTTVGDSSNNGSLTGYEAVGELVQVPTGVLTLSSITLGIGSNGAPVHVEVDAWNATTQQPGTALFSGDFIGPDGHSSHSFSPNITVTPGSAVFLQASQPSFYVQTTASMYAASDSTGAYGGAAYAEANDGTPFMPLVGTDLVFSATFGDTATTVTTSNATPVYGETVTYTATVTGGDASHVPAGTVTFTANGTSLGTATLDATTGAASLDYATLPAGAQTVVATYTPSSSETYSGSSGNIVETVAAASTSLSIAVDHSPVAAGAPFNLTGTITALAPGAGTPSSAVVAFYNGSTFLCNAGTSTGVATCSASLSPIGTYDQINAMFYSYDSNYANSTSGNITVVVETGSSTTLTSSDKGASTFGATPTFTATVTGATPTGSVTFTNDTTGVTLCNAVALNNGVATCPTSGMPVGGNSISATYGGDDNNVGSTGSLTEAVSQAIPVVSMVNPGDATVGSTVTFTAMVTGVNGATQPSGNVQFTVDGSLVNTVALIGGSASTAISFNQGGVTFRVIATYVGDTNYASESSPTINEQVDKAELDVGLASSRPTAAPGASVTFTATLSGMVSGIVAGGTITFKDGNTTVGSGTVDPTTQAVSITTSTLSTGTHTITAHYSGDGNYAAGDATPITETIAVNATGVVVSANETSWTYGDSITFTSTLAGSTAHPPTGSVSFTDGTTTLCASASIVVGTSSVTAVCTTTALPPASQTVTATYEGDANNGAGSGSITQVVAKASTTTALTSSLNPASYGQAITLTATVKHAVAGTLGGTVVFKDGTTSYPAVAVGSDGTATLVTSQLAAASHAFTASYSGDTNFAASAGSLSQTINATVTTLALSSSSNPAAIGATITLSAAITPAVGTGIPTGSVELYDNTTTKIGTTTLDSGGVARLAISTLAAGTHALSAVYLGDGNFITSTGAGLSQVISGSASTLSVVASPSPATYGATVTFSASVTGTLGIATGTVTVTDGTTQLGSITLDAKGAGSFTSSSLSVGTHALTTAYSGDGNYGASTGTLQLTVNRAATTTTLAASPNPATTSDKVKLTVTVTSAVPGVDGMVQLFDGAQLLANVALANGVATFSTTFKAGTHTLVAQYGGSTNFATGSSTSVTETVTSAEGADGGTVSSDAGTTGNDGGTSSGDGAMTTTKHGSGGCAVSPTSRPSWLFLLLLGVFVAVRRERCHAKRP